MNRNRAGAVPGSAYHETAATGKVPPQQGLPKR
jgi:hypothetical protein